MKSRIKNLPNIVNRPLKITLITLASVVGFVLFVLLFVLLFGGPIAKTVVENHSPQWVGRQITMDSPRINLFNGSVSLTDVHMLEQDGKTDFVRFDTLYAQISLFRLMGKEVYLRHIWLSGLNASIVNLDSCFNFQDIIDHFASTDTVPEVEEEPEDTTASSWGIGLYDIRLRRGAVSYTDMKRLSRWGIEDIDIAVPGLYFGRDQSEAGVSLSFPNDCGSVRVAANLDQDRGTFDVDVDMDTIRLDLARPFLTEYVRISRLGSRLSGCVKAAGRFDDIAAVGITGNLLLTGTDIRDTDDHTLLSLERVAVDVDSVDLGTMEVRINEVAIEGLHTTFERWDESNTISRLLVDASTAPTDTVVGEQDTVVVSREQIEDTVTITTKEQKELKLLIRRLRISDINLTYRDHTLQKPFSYTISHLGVSADDLTLDGQNSVSLRADLPQGGKVNARWTGGLDISKDDETLTLNVKNMQLSAFSPWCEEYTASPITGGALSITSDNRIRSGMLRGANNVDIYGMTVGEKVSPSEAPYKAVPVKLGVALLEDLEHKIQLSLPVSGDINNPQFSYRKIIWKTLGNVLLKATASPWVALGKALGIGGVDLSRLPVNTLQPDFTSEQYATIDQLVELMRQQEELTLAMTQQFNMAEAVASQKTFDAKRAYYESRNGAIEQPSLAIIEEINDIRDHDAGLRSYLEDHPVEVSDSVAIEEVMRMASFRVRILSDYLIRQQGLSAERVSVKTLSAAELEQYEGAAEFAVGSAQPEVSFE